MAVMSLEERYSVVRATPGDLGELLKLALATVSRVQRERRLAQVLEMASPRLRVRMLEEAGARMHGDDVDAASRFAVTGDLTRAIARIAPHLSTPRGTRRRPGATPWRQSGWLKRRRA